MNGRELYEAIKEAAKAFGISYHEINLIKVETSYKKITFLYKNKEYVINID